MVPLDNYLSKVMQRTQRYQYVSNDLTITKGEGKQCGQQQEDAEKP